MVARTLDYQIDLDPLSTLESLTQKRGDCSEHADLFAALARSVGIPTRSISGWICLRSEEPTFGYHAWNEVAIDGKWVAIDATWGELVPNATHLKMELAEADQQFARKVREGKLSLQVVSVKIDAETRLREAGELIRKYPKEPTWREARAGLYLGLERYPEAILDLKEAIALSPETAEYHGSLATALREQGELVKAAAAQREAARLSPKHPGYRSELAWLQSAADDHKGALAAIDQALVLRPANAEYLDARAFFNYRQKDYPAALLDIEKALKISTLDPELHITRGLILDEMEDFAGAEGSYTNAINLDPEDGWLHLQRETARTKLNEPEGARRDLQKALRTGDLDFETKLEIRGMLRALEKKVGE